MTFLFGKSDVNQKTGNEKGRPSELKMTGLGNWSERALLADRCGEDLVGEFYWRDRAERDSSRVLELTAGRGDSHHDHHLVSSDDERGVGGKILRAYLEDRVCAESVEAGVVLTKIYHRDDTFGDDDELLVLAELPARVVEIVLDVSEVRRAKRSPANPTAVGVVPNGISDDDLESRPFLAED